MSKPAEAPATSIGQARCDAGSKHKYKEAAIVSTVVIISLIMIA